MNIGPLGDEWAFPDSCEEFLELGELMRTQLFGPFAFDFEQDGINHGIGGMAAAGQANRTSATVSGIRIANKVAKFTETAQKLVHRLLAHGSAFGEDAGALAFRSRIQENGDVRQAQVVEAGGIQLGDNSAVDGHGWNTEERANEDVFSLVENLCFGRRH